MAPGHDPSRRAFSRRLAGVTAAVAGGSAATGAGALLGLAPARAGAQGQMVAGKDYVVLDKPVQVAAGGKIELVDFFWYGCPHCYAFEPDLEHWVAGLAPDVHFQRIAYGYDQRLREMHQQIYYTWEALNLVEAMHLKTFDRFHKEKKPINEEADLLLFASESGLDVDRVRQAWSSFGVQTRMRLARQACDAWGVDFVPLLGIQGRFLTAPANVGSNARALAAADTLINLVRKGG